MSESLKQKIDHLPTQPGVYLMKDVRGRIIYVGKAKDLKRRVLSYFKRDSHGAGAKTAILVGKIEDVDTIVTHTEKEALILEANLIKRHRPRYNVILKDDKRYPCLRLDVQSPFPNLTVSRKLRKDGAVYFGPFAAAGAVKETLKLINRTFKLRKCKGTKVEKRDRPCLNYQMDLCLGPCSKPVPKEEYEKIVKEVTLLLKGRMPQLVEQVKRDMEDAASRQDFEAAAGHRDRLYALENTLEKQVVTAADLKDRDVVGVAGQGQAALVMVLFIRGGFLLGNRPFYFPESALAKEEIVGSFLKQYYDEASFIPNEVLIPVVMEDKTLLEERLSDLKTEKVHIVIPSRGQKAALLHMANENAEKALEERLRTAMMEEGMLDRVRNALALTKRPDRIECIDLSNLAGTQGVGAVIVFERGKALPQAYRKYRIKTASPDDDYSMLKEVLTRRYGKSDGEAQLPDLLMVDGGKGQLSITVAVLKELGLLGAFDVAAIAKKEPDRGEKEDKIFKPGRKNPLQLNTKPDVLLFLQRIRDEAHRFVVRYQRKRRMMTYRKSALEGIAGIGPKRRAELLRHFGSLKRIKEATAEQIQAATGMNRHAAEDLLTALR